jgi:alpha-L-arabinofuranosidase
VKKEKQVIMSVPRPGGGEVLQVVKMGEQVVLSLLNWHPTRAARVAVTLTGANMRDEAKVLRLTGPGPNAYNEDGQPARIVMEDDVVEVLPRSPAPNAPPVADVTIQMKPCSMCTVTFEIE